MSNTFHKIKTMLSIQDELNQIVDPNWRERGFTWEDAITVEAVELFDHLPWKWWKKHTAPVDLEQVKLEAIDIWHFLMSAVLECFSLEESATLLNMFASTHDQGVELTPDIERIKGATRSLLSDVTYAYEIGSPTPGAYVNAFFRLLACLGITIDELYVTYIAKTQLNRLRWENGYGTTYIKTWFGQEDNVWLAEYVKTLDVNAPDFKDQVYKGLVAQYEKVKEAA